MNRAGLAVKLTVLLFCASLFLVSAQPAQAIRNTYVSSPSTVPFFEFTSTPEIAHGESGVVSFKIDNRYLYPIYDADIVMEIYEYATLNENKNISRIDSPPKIVSTNDISAQVPLGDIAKDSNVSVSFTIKVGSDVPEGTYFLRFTMSFTYSTTDPAGSAADFQMYTMKSRGYFTDEAWNNATFDSTSGTLAKIDIDALGVDGIIPDSSFSVKDPIPVWPLILMIGLAVFFGAIAYIFYMSENYNKYQKFEAKYQRFKGKVQLGTELTKKDLAKIKKNKEGQDKGKEE